MRSQPVFTRGRAGVPEFSDECVQDAAVRALYPRIRVVTDAAYPIESIRMDVRLRTGAVLTRTVECARGSLERPLSDADLERKLVTLAAHGAPGLDTAPLIEALWRLDEIDDAGSLMRMAAGARRA